MISLGDDAIEVQTPKARARPADASSKPASGGAAKAAPAKPAETHARRRARR